MILNRLLRDQRGGSAIEFAVAAPFLLAFIFGLAQLGILAVAKNGLQHAAAEAVRVAAVYPRPSTATIAAAVDGTRFGLDPDRLSSPDVSTSVDSGITYLTVRLTYSVQMQLLFMPTKTITLVEQRRVAVHS